MVAAAIPKSQTQPKNEQFYKLTLEELKQDYKNKRINSEAYLKYLIKTKLAAGWEWRFNVKQFCADWEIVERTFYWALSRLKTRNEISFRSANDNIILWWNKKVAIIVNIHSSDSANSPNPDAVIAPQDVTDPLQDISEASQDITDSLQDISDENGKTVAVVESHTPLDSLEINHKINTDFHERVCVVFEKLLDEEPKSEQENIDFGNETNQDGNLGSPTTLFNNTKTLQVVDIIGNEGLGSAALISNTENSQVVKKTSDKRQYFASTDCKNDEPSQDAIDESSTTLLGEVEALQVANKTSSEGKGFVPPIRKTSQKQKWVCPGTDEEKNKFLVFKGELLVSAKQCKPVEARTAALSWANHKPEVANLLWEDWQKFKVQGEDANESGPSSQSGHETVPEFRRMPGQEHAEVLRKFVNHTKQEFLKLCWWHEYWLEFACHQFRVGQQLVPGLTAEIIKQIKA